jgi:hypothetical protein
MGTCYFGTAECRQLVSGKQDIRADDCKTGSDRTSKLARTGTRLRRTKISSSPCPKRAIDKSATPRLNASELDHVMLSKWFSITPTFPSKGDPLRSVNAFFPSKGDPLRSFGCDGIETKSALRSPQNLIHSPQL